MTLSASAIGRGAFTRWLPLQSRTIETRGRDGSTQTVGQVRRAIRHHGIGWNEIPVFDHRARPRDGSALGPDGQQWSAVHRALTSSRTNRMKRSSASCRRGGERQSRSSAPRVDPPKRKLESLPRKHRVKTESPCSTDAHRVSVFLTDERLLRLRPRLHRQRAGRTTRAPCRRRSSASRVALVERRGTAGRHVRRHRHDPEQDLSRGRHVPRRVERGRTARARARTAARPTRRSCSRASTRSSRARGRSSRISSRATAST